MPARLVASFLLFGLLGISGESVLAKSNALKIYELKSVVLQDRSTLAFNSLDGVGSTSFWIVLEKDKIVAASFDWAVKPGSKPRLNRAILINKNSSVEIKADITYDFQTLSGSISTPDKKYDLDVKKPGIKLIETWQSSKQAHDFSELEKLIENTPIKILKQK